MNYRRELNGDGADKLRAETIDILKERYGGNMPARLGPRSGFQIIYNSIEKWNLFIN